MPDRGEDLLIESSKLLLTLPSLFIKLEDGTPVAWAFLGKWGNLL
jgi:hypothetical protein